MSICFKVFHIADSNESLLRKNLSQKISQYLEQNGLSYLDTPTFKIFDELSLKNFIESNIDFKVDLDGYDLDNVRGWRFGEIGIWASNFVAIKSFLQTDHEYAILMEDDITFDNTMIDLLKKYLEEVPLDFDIFSMFVPEDQYHKFSQAHEIGKEDICRAYHDWSMLCYIVSRSGAEKILKDINDHNIFLPLDWYFYRQQHKFNVYTVKPNSSKGCTLVNTESTFQTTQERKNLNGIF